MRLFKRKNPYEYDVEMRNLYKKIFSLTKEITENELYFDLEISVKLGKVSLTSTVRSKPFEEDESK